MLESQIILKFLWRACCFYHSRGLHKSLKRKMDNKLKDNIQQKIIVR